MTRTLIASALLLLATAPRHVNAQISPLGSSVQKPYEAHVVIATGDVTRLRDQQPWAVIEGEPVPVRQTITTGPDGYARFELAGGSRFELFANSQVIFRRNTANEGDLLDVLAGRVRAHFHPTGDQPVQRIFTPAAILSSTQPATVSLAIDEDNTVRIDILEGQIKIQHALLPRATPITVKAIDAVLVQPGEPLVYQAAHGTFYRYAIKPILILWTYLIPYHERDNRFIVMARLSPTFSPPNIR